MLGPKKSKRVLHFFIIFTLPIIEFEHAQISVPKVGTLMLKIFLDQNYFTPIRNN